MRFESAVHLRLAHLRSAPEGKRCQGVGLANAGYVVVSDAFQTDNCTGNGTAARPWTAKEGRSVICPLVSIDSCMC
jgi:hypothetical protein